MMSDKIRCTVCGRLLNPCDFYHTENTKNKANRCKDCDKKRAKDWYNKNLKVKDGVFLDEKSGRLMEHKGCSKKIYWDGNMLSIMKRYYPITLNSEMAEMLGVSPRTVIRKAREMGLEKDKEWWVGVATNNARLGAIKVKELWKDIKSSTK